MMSSSIFLRGLAVFLLAFTLAACKSAADRAEEYFQSALSLIESGDTDRAIVELRNVFELDSSHRDARAALARIMLDRNNIQAAYSNYLRLAEQYPEDLEARRALAEIAFEVRNWDEFDRHGKVAEEIAPEEPRVKAIALGRQYRTAVQDEDESARLALLPKAEALQEELPDNQILANILIDGYTRDSRYEAALDEVDQMIADAPDNRALYTRRMALLNQMGDISALEAQMRDLVDRFPNDLEAKSLLVRFYISRGEFDAAEAFLRDISDPAAEDPGLFVDLIRFVGEVHGPEAARKELERAIEVNPKPGRFIAMRALLDFTSGKQDAAIAELEKLLEGVEPSEETRDIQVILARMLSTKGNEVGARRLVEEVLAADANHVEALKMQAAWQIRADDTDGAIANLRLALDKAPEDVQAMNLMAEAYTRAGSHDLARDFLALAVDASNNAPGPSIRYAQLLAQEERYLAAEDVLKPALQLAPQNVELLVALGRLYLPMEDLGRASQVVDTLRRIGTPQAEQAANGLQAAILNARQGTDEAVAFLEGLAQGDDADLNSKVALLRARLATGDTEAALNLANELVAENPDDERMIFARAVTRGAVGDLEAAEADYRALLETDKARPAVWLELSRVLMRQGKPDAAKAAIEDALAALPQDANLLWAKASFLEQGGDVDGAIAIYEALYERASESIVIANNLASLLSSHREDAESLDRAWTIARRLKGADNPALQDTYGWIAFRRGETEEALPYLEGAAEGLPRDPIVQVHLGLAYAALDRTEEALSYLQKAIELAGPADTRPQIETAREEIARLREAQNQN